MKLFGLNRDISIALDSFENEAILLAARDLRRDLLRISGKNDGFDIKKEACSTAIRIRTSGEGVAESYTVRVTQGGIEILGSDTLGTVYGIYAFSEKVLGVLPMHRLIDRFPKTREEMEIDEGDFVSPERRVRYRGWFLNDEDLLTEWKMSGGKRRIDYPFYGDVMDVSVLDLILETALRLEINLIIPSSFVDICNGVEEKLVAAVCRRGLYVSQHHVEPVGVSYFGADNYLKDRGIDGENVSFIGNRARMEEIWRHYINKWAKYGDHVIWQLGLRGKGDRSVWRTDPTVPNGDAVRGAIITDAIATQHKMISEALGTPDFLSTATLWNEGSGLYRGGHLRLPKGTIAIFSDIGFNQMFGGDFYSTERNPDDKYGIYYHVGFWVQGPHLAEGTDLKKMAFSYREAAKMNSLYYSILNVSNVRPLHFSAWLCSKILNDPENADTEKLVCGLISELYGEDADKISPLLWGYYGAIADRGKNEIRYMCERNEFDYNDLGEMPFPERPITDGVLRYAIGKSLHKKDLDYTESAEEFGKTLEENLPKWEALLKRAEETRLCEENRLYFEQFLKFEIFYMAQMTKATVACRRFMDAEDARELDRAFGEACAAFDAIIEKRKILELGEWEGWHRGDKKIDVARWRAEIEKIYPKRKAEIA